MYKQLMIHYLKDRKAYIFLYIFMTCALIFYFHTLVEGSYTLFYPIFLSVLPLFIFLLVDSIKYIRFSKGLKQNIEGQPIDLNPTTSEQKLVHDLIVKMNTHGNEQYQQLKKNYREHLYFSSHFLHHLKAPLSVMDIVLEDEADVEQIRMMAKEQIKRMNGTVNQALSLVRSDAFEKDLMVESVDLIRLIHEILAEVQPECELASVEPIVLSEQSEVVIISDRKWFKVCIEQLISNAIKYSRPKEGVKKLEILIEQRQSAVFLHIKDNGLGIPTYDQSRIFDPFFTGENGRTNAFSSGLGLYLCKRICSQLDHKLTFNSEHQIGTCFTLQLKSISKNLTNM